MLKVIGCWPGVRAMNLPNVLTLLRIFLVPFLVVFLIASPASNATAAAIFLAAVLTDWLDGRIARRRHQVTTLGKLLDPIADKLLVSAALISLVQVGRAPAWIVVLIVGRDIAVTGLRGIAAAQGAIISANEFGKATMVANVTAIAILILEWSPGALPLGHLALLVAAGLSLSSGVMYFRRFWHVIDLTK